MPDETQETERPEARKARRAVGHIGDPSAIEIPTNSRRVHALRPSGLLPFCSSVLLPFRSCLHTSARCSRVRFEQAVYGSFAFNDQGYSMLAASPGCRPEWLADFRAACRNLGEPPAGASDAPGLFSLRLPSGPHAVVGVFAQGRDDQGRPGAMAFHGLFLSHRNFRRMGYNPFALAGNLRGDWSPDVRLTTCEWVAGAESSTPRSLGEAANQHIPPQPDVPCIVKALRKRRRVALESPVPIDELARNVWIALPVRIRARSSLATWAFGNANRFDLFGTPRRAGILLDSTYLDVTPPDSPERSLWRSPHALVILAASAALAIVGVVFALQGDRDLDPKPVSSNQTRLIEPIADDPRDETPAERRRFFEALIALCGRFDVDVENLDASDPGALIERFAAETRYDGPMLSDADRVSLVRKASHDAALALRWDAHVRRFAAELSLPPGLRLASTRQRLALLARSYHVEGDVLGAPWRSPAERVQALGEALAVDFPLHPIPLAARYPALTDYRAFLSRLPRR